MINFHNNGMNTTIKALLDWTAENFLSLSSSCVLPPGSICSHGACHLGYDWLLLTMQGIQYAFS